MKAETIKNHLVPSTLTYTTLVPRVTMKEVATAKSLDSPRLGSGEVEATAATAHAA